MILQSRIRALYETCCQYECLGMISSLILAKFQHTISLTQGLQVIKLIFP